MDVSGSNNGYYMQNYAQPVHTNVIQNATPQNYNVVMGADDEHSAAHRLSQANQTIGNQRLQQQQQQMPIPVPNGIIINSVNLPHGIVPHSMENRQKQQTMPPTPPGESQSADEKDQEEDKRRILLNMIPDNGMMSGQTSNSSNMVPPLPSQFNMLNMPGPVNASQMMMLQQNNSQFNSFQQIPNPGPESSSYSFNHDMVHGMHQQQLDDELEDDMLEDDDDDDVPGPKKRSKRRNNKRAVCDDDKDDRYFERRKRNNLAAKRSRDARKIREEHIGMRASFLEKENAMLHAQLNTLREESNALRQLLNQRSMMPSSHHQLPPVPAVHQGLPPSSVSHQNIPQQQYSP